MSACEAMMEASAERTTSAKRRFSGTMWKNGLRSGVAASAALPLFARIQAPWPR